MGPAARCRRGICRIKESPEIAERRVVAYLDHDEALLAILYEAAGNPVLVSTIQTLWEHCRAYKIVGAQAALVAPGDDPLWRYQQRLVAAARDHDGDAAAAVNKRIAHRRHSPHQGPPSGLVSRIPFMNSTPISDARHGCRW